MLETVDAVEEEDAGTVVALVEAARLEDCPDDEYELVSADGRREDRAVDIVDVRL